MFSDISQLFYIYSGTGYHCQNLSRGRLYGNKAAYLVVHQHLAVVLELGVDGGGDVLAGNSFLIHLSILESGHDLVAGVPDHDVVTLLAPEFLFSGRFYACLAGVVSCLVFSFMFLDICGINLGHITEKVSSGIVRVISDGSRLASEAWELILDFRELHVCFLWHLLYHDHGAPADL